MDEFITHMLSMQSVYLMTAIIGTTWIIRRVAETAFPALRKNADANHPDVTYATAWSRWWNEVILYLIPMGVGLSSAVNRIAIFHGDDAVFEGIASRAVYGFVLAFMSGTLYKVLNKAFKARTGMNLPGAASSPPPPPEEVN